MSLKYERKGDMMNIELTYDDRTAIMKVDGILTSENSYILQDKLTEVLTSSQKVAKLKWCAVHTAFTSCFPCSS
jgi:hypothetical protein